ncbi:32344_t:CDS:1, partial [Gigaspora margarita]
LSVKCQMPFNKYENPDFIAHTGLSKLYVSTVSKYFNGTADIVHEKIKTYYQKSLV